MDITPLAGLAGYIVSELASFLSGFSKDIAKEAMSRLYEQIKAKFSQKSKSDVLDEFEKSPNTQDTQEDLRHYLEKYMRDDEMFARVLADIVKEYNPSRVTSNIQFKGGQEIVSSPIITGEHVHIYYGGNSGPEATLSGESVKNKKITIYITSNRFKKELKYPVEKDIRVSEFVNMVISNLNLPKVKIFPDIMFEMAFGYSLLLGDKGLSDLKFTDLQIEDGARLVFSIRAVITDQIEKLEFEESELGPAIYDQTRLNELVKRDKAKRARGKVDKEKIDALINSVFSYIDKR